MYRKCPSLEFPNFFLMIPFHVIIILEHYKEGVTGLFFHAKAFVSLAIPTHVLAHLKFRMPLYRQLFMICYGYRWQLRVLARAPTASDLMFWNVYCSESHSAAVKDSLPGPPWKIYFQLLTILAIFLLKNNERKFEMENTCWLALRSECLFRDCESSNR